MRGTYVRRPTGCYWTVTLLQALVVYCLMVPFGDAWATAKVGDVITRTVRNYDTLPTVMNYGAIIAGMVCVVIGIQKLRKHVERPDQFPISQGLWHIAGGTFLFSVPAAWGILVRSFNLLQTGTNGTEGVSTIALKAAATSPLSLDVMMIRFVQNVRGPIQFLLWTLSAILGLFFMISAFLRMARGATVDGPRGSVGSGTLTRVFIGSILLSLAATSDIFTRTLFSGSVVQFSGMTITGVAPAAITQANQAITAILVFVQIIGFIAFMRGFLMLRALADGNSSISTAAAFTHIVGGALAINISPFLSALQNTFCDKAATCKVMGFT